MTTPDLDELAKLEEEAVRLWKIAKEGDHESPEDSVNAVTNRDQRWIMAVRADQAVAAWWVANSQEAKACIHYARIIHDAFHA